jgi:hypothetical protein
VLSDALELDFEQDGDYKFVIFEVKKEGTYHFSVS